MSNYTIELKKVCEYFANYTPPTGWGDTSTWKNYQEIIGEARPKIFDFEYPIFDESYRVLLETKFLNTFLFKEISYPEVARWKHALMVKFNEVLPYYNQLYKSELLKFDPFTDVDMTKDYVLKEKGSNDKNGTSKTEIDINDKRTGSITDKNKLGGKDQSTGDASNKNTDVYSDTPQGALNGLENMSYMSEARIVQDSGTTSSSTTYGKTEDRNKIVTDLNDKKHKSQSTNSSKDVIENLSDYIEHTIGHNGGTTHSKMLKEFRETFLNIDKMLLDECKDLFMLLY